MSDALGPGHEGLQRQNRQGRILSRPTSSSNGPGLLERLFEGGTNGSGPQLGQKPPPISGHTCWELSDAGAGLGRLHKTRRLDRTGTDVNHQQDARRGRRTSTLEALGGHDFADRQH